MRVISGSAGGLRLKTPEGLNTRPTLDRIKESLFNILSNDLLDADFLDLFSGSGGIGIEALSRGAASAVFVDESKISANIIKENLKFTRLEDKAEVLNMDFITAVRKLKNKGRSFDIIYMDPPYNKGFVQSALNAVYESKILKKNGFIIAEQAIQDDIGQITGFEIYRVKKYKITKMTFLKYTEDIL